MDLSPLRHREYRLLYIAQSVSFLGTMVSYAALPYHIYRLTGSSLAVGLLGLAELVPLLGTAFVGGVLADAVDRRRLGLATDAALAGGSALTSILLPRLRRLSVPLALLAGCAALGRALTAAYAEHMLNRLVVARGG